MKEKKIMKSFRHKSWYCEWDEVTQEFSCFLPIEMKKKKEDRVCYAKCLTPDICKEIIKAYLSPFEMTRIYDPIEWIISISFSAVCISISIVIFFIVFSKKPCENRNKDRSECHCQTYDRADVSTVFPSDTIQFPKPLHGKSNFE
jgi:hypothetical protein